MREQGAEPVGGPPSVLADHARAETEKWAKVVKAANVKLD
jgi:hypothetical protein